MADFRRLSIDSDSTRADILRNLDPEDFAWAVPIMRAGYAGRGLVYLVVAGVSLWSISQGGEAEGTSQALDKLQGGLGFAVVGLIVLGMLAYAVWRAVDSFWDLEAYGTDAKGLVARAGMVATGTAHFGIGVLALAVLIGRSGGGGGGMGEMLDRVMQAPGGRVAVGVAGLLTIAAGIYYLHKAFTEGYRDHLCANRFTTHFNIGLKAGVAAQGVAVTIIGVLIAYAALTATGEEAGGMGSAFEWLHAQAYGRVLVAGLCFGLLAFAFFCFVNAAYRIIPKAAGDDIETLAAKLTAKARGA
ncbi:DUF1206 domain-containing protein [Algicella marina]|uniref:DUF1206 domain-containing protein n=1 Tax=Algicella marina TaxID=2683284 RepID=A0A6P1T2Z6_9RHOB|nr:DUF1206 domain-containing protein [Algicella marina]QHQ35836.1 DUF1206 domain-containing protein [Algicella marina]